MNNYKAKRGIKNTLDNKSIIRKVIKFFVIILFITLTLFLAVIFIFFTSRDRSVLFQDFKTINVAGVKRDYLISYPNSSRPKKLVVGLHGFGDSPRKFAYYTALHNSVDDQTIVVYPSAIKPEKTGQLAGWNSGFCCGSGWVSGIDDVSFIESLIKKISSSYDIKSKDVYLVGFSNGAFMAQRFAVDKPEMIGGIAVASGTIGTVKSRLYPKNAVPILLMHSKKDATIPYYGGVAKANPEFDWLPFGDTESAWLSVNHGSALTRKLIFDDIKHQWNGWRIFNFWHSKTNASDEAVIFFNNL